jgi:hypothetical protein
MDEVEDFLAHYGVKGMKWGERKVRPAGAPSRRPSKETVKNVGTELAFGSLGPAAVLAGLGPPISIAIGLSAAVLSKPAVRNAIAETSKAQAALVKELGETKISAMKQARASKADIKRNATRVANVADKAIDASILAALNIEKTALL